MNVVRRRPVGACLGLLAALALAGCGGGGGGQGASLAQPTGTAPAPAPTPTPAAPPAPAPAPPTPPTDPAPPVTCAPGDAPAFRSEAFALVNIIRTAVGLPQFQRVAALDGTAQAHAQYAVANGSQGSDEQPGLPCYTGTTLVQRLAAAGVVTATVPGTRPHSESVLAYDTPAGVELKAWDVVNAGLHNLYGRLQLLAPAVQQVGVGFSARPGAQQRALVLDAAVLAGTNNMAASDSWVTWPRDGTTGLPARMTASNLKPLAAGLVEGYPASLHATAPVQVRRFVMTLATSGTPVPATLLTQATDRHGFLSAGEVALVPDAPLAAGTTYRVELDATVGTRDVLQAWSFTTAP